MDGLTLRAEDEIRLTEDVLDRVQRGESVRITRAGEVIATLVPSATVAPLSPDAFKAMMKRVAENREKLRAMGVTYSPDMLRDIRDNPETA